MLAKILGIALLVIAAFIAFKLAIGILKIVLPIMVLVVGGVVAGLLVSARQMPERVERRAAGPLVEVITTAVADVPVVVHGHGEVSAKVAVEVVPEVTGRVVEVHPSLVAGGFFKAGEDLVRIENAIAVFVRAYGYGDAAEGARLARRQLIDRDCVRSQLWFAFA